MTSEERARQFLDQAEPIIYDYDLEFLTSQFDLHAAEQREECADRVSDECVWLHVSVDVKNLLIDVCINATGEET